MYKIDVKRQVEEMEQTLRRADDPAGRQATLTILRRWQFDDMLDDTSREKARLLVLECGRNQPASPGELLALQYAADATGGSPIAQDTTTSRIATDIGGGTVVSGQRSALEVAPIPLQFRADR
jgi:hypothetical protein